MQKTAKKRTKFKLHVAQGDYQPSDFTTKKSLGLTAGVCTFKFRLFTLNEVQFHLLLATAQKSFIFCEKVVV